MIRSGDVLFIDAGSTLFHLAKCIGHDIALRKKVVPLAKQVIAVADKTKFGYIGFVTGIVFEQCDILVTEEEIPDEFRQLLSGKVSIIT